MRTYSSTKSACVSAIIKIGLTEEHADKVMAAYDEAMRGYVTKGKLAEVEAENATLAIRLKDRDTQLEALKKEAATADVAGLQKRPKPCLTWAWLSWTVIAYSA